MKRSYMIRLIKNAIKNAAKGQEAHVVLREMEAAGMLPPTTKLDKLDGSDNGWENECSSSDTD